MTWCGVLGALVFVLWIHGPVTCERDFDSCTFNYWRVDWKSAVRACEEEDKQLLCYKSKKRIDDITEAFRLTAYGNAKLELWLSRKNCSSTGEMEECLSLHIQKTDKTVWHYFQTKCGEETYPFVCCINETGEETTTSIKHTTENLNTTSDVFEIITDSSSLTTSHTESTRRTPFCKKVLERGVLWPDTDVDKEVVRPCPGNATGEARWFCENVSNGKWKESGPDMTRCRSLQIRNLKERFNSSSASDVISELESIFENRERPVFGQDLADVLSLMTALPDRLFQEMESVPTSAAKWASTKNHVDKAMSVIDRVVELNATWHDIPEKGRSKVGTHLLSTVDGMGSLLADSMPEKDAEQSIIGRNMALQVMKPNFGESVSLPQWVVTSRYSHRGTVMLEKGYDSQLNKDDGNVSLVFALYTDMSSILLPAQEEEKNRTSSLNSAVLSTTVTLRRKPVQIHSEVRIVVEHLTPNPNKSACVFWNMDRNRWDTVGCRLESSNMTYSVCVCNHLTNFALLMDYENILSEVDQLPFHYITLIGCSLSIACLSICICIFSCYSYHSRHSWGLRYVIHRNLSLCLLIANLVLVIGLDRTDNQRVCAFVAGLLHYFFLAAFSWMFLEAVHIYLLLVVVFASRRSHWEKYYLFGYGVPIIIVAITASSRPTYYGTDEVCWLSAEKGTIWGFMGPVAAILILNTAALILAQYKASRISAKDDKAALVKRWLRVTLILFPILGITWIFGFLYLGKHFEVVGYLFAIFNSFQGVCIFVFHCLLDKKARNMVMDSFKKKSTSINTGSSGTQKKMKDQAQNGTKPNPITPVDIDDLHKTNRIERTFPLPGTENKKKNWSKWRKPWSFCFELPVTDRSKDSQKRVKGKPTAVIVHWNSLRDKNGS